MLVASGQPAQVIVLRHAEKPDDPAAEHLSPRGEERARALAQFLGKGSSLTSNVPIAALYANRVTKHARGQRPGETLAPLATQLGLEVRTPYDADRYDALARDLLADASYGGKPVVVC